MTPTSTLAFSISTHPNPVISTQGGLRYRRRGEPIALALAAAFLSFHSERSEEPALALAAAIALLFVCHPERSDCAFAIAQSKDLPPVPPPQSLSTHSASAAITLVPRGFSLGSHSTLKRKGALAPEARP
jgi:hypothetical protein